MNITRACWIHSSKLKLLNLNHSCLEWICGFNSCSQLIWVTTGGFNWKKPHIYVHAHIVKRHICPRKVFNKASKTKLVTMFIERITIKLFSDGSNVEYHIRLPPPVTSKIGQKASKHGYGPISRNYRWKTPEKHVTHQFLSPYGIGELSLGSIRLILLELCSSDQNIKK